MYYHTIYLVAQLLKKKKKDLAYKLMPTIWIKLLFW